MSVRSELKQICKSHDDVLLPQDVVDYARNPATALHKRFEWDDTAAAHEYRLVQARHLIRSVHVVYEDNTGKCSVRAYVSLSPDRGEESYRSIASVISCKDWRRQMLADALAELKAFQAKYAALKALDPVWKAVARVLKKEDRG